MATKKKIKVKKGRTATTKKSSKNAKKKVVIASLAVSAGILCYFGWKYFKKKKTSSSSNDFDAILKLNNNVIEQPITNTTAQPIEKQKAKSAYTYNNSSNTAGKNDFPLKKGSKGDLVRQLQEALIAKYGKSILPKYGADSDFGTEVANALKKLGLPSSINESTFNVITAVTKVNVATIGKELYNAVNTKNYSSVISSLKKLKSTEDYAKANDTFMTYRVNGVHQTLVNGLLNTFSNASQKDSIKMEFLRMGLTYDGGKWALSGLEGISLITIEPTTIWVNAKESVEVPAKMVLGNEVSKRLDYTLFENKGKYFLVNTKSVNYI